MQQKPSTIMLGRIVYWIILTASLPVIYLIPVRPQSNPNLNLFFSLLLYVSFIDLAMMKYVDYMIMKRAAEQRRRLNVPSPQAAPIVLAGIGASTAIYGILVHLLGGSTLRSLIFVCVSIIGYIEFTLLSAKYASLLSDQSGE